MSIIPQLKNKTKQETRKNCQYKMNSLVGRIRVSILDQRNS